MRSLRYGPNAAVWIGGYGRRAGEVVEDTGLGPVRVRELASGIEESVEAKDLSVRRTPPGPPPGAGGRDLPPLRFGDRQNPGPDHVEAYRTRGWREGPERQRSAGTVAAPVRLEPQPKTSVHRDEDHKAWVRGLPCAVPWCKKPGPSECAHARGPRGISQKVDDHRTFPACGSCHQELHAKATLGRLDVDATRELERDMVIETMGLRLRWLAVELARVRGHNRALLERARPAGGD